MATGFEGGVLYLWSAMGCTANAMARLLVTMADTEELPYQPVDADQRIAKLHPHLVDMLLDFREQPHKMTPDYMMGNLFFMFRAAVPGGLLDVLTVDGYSFEALREISRGCRRMYTGIAEVQEMLDKIVDLADGRELSSEEIRAALPQCVQFLRESYAVDIKPGLVCEEADESYDFESPVPLQEVLEGLLGEKFSDIAEVVESDGAAEIGGDLPDKAEPAPEGDAGAGVFN